MTFDAYSATLREPGYGVDAEPVAEELAAELGGVVVPEDRGMHGYTSQLLVKLPELSDRGPVRVLYGGRNGWASVQVQGAASTAVAAAVRSRWVHEVTRVDACQDFDQADAFQRLTDDAIGFAQDWGLKLRTDGDWITGEDGRTLYVGSRKSPAMLRIYEKGKQPQYALREDVSRNWVRAELETHPKGRQRWESALVTPAEVWGMSRWSQALHEQWTGLDVGRIDPTAWNQPDDERAFRFMVQQYGPMLFRQANLHGREEMTARLWRTIDRRMGVGEKEDV